MRRVAKPGLELTERGWGALCVRLETSNVAKSFLSASRFYSGILFSPRRGVPFQTSLGFLAVGTVRGCSARRPRLEVVEERKHFCAKSCVVLKSPMLITLLKGEKWQYGLPILGQEQGETTQSAR